jgi:uncharacterized membrane protein
MPLSDLASIGSLLSGIAVVISLIYLAFQIRQNTRHQRASMQQGRAARTVDLLLRTAEPDMAQAILRGRMADGAIEPAELEQFLRATTAIFISFEDGYVLRRAGMLDATTIAGDDAALKHHILPWPGYRIAWEMLKTGMQPDFRDYVDELAEKTPLMASSDRLVTWKKLATEQAGNGA